MASNNQTTNATLAFTLPISCQICLGKVKQPVVCPNQHAFCDSCMQVWLERNQQCPACRIPITSTNPCKKILGGFNTGCETDDSFSSKEHRRARIELLFREYEEEIVRLQNEAQLHAAEKESLQLKLSEMTVNPNGRCPTCSGEGQDARRTDADVLTALTAKLRDATSLYDKIKEDISKLKKENQQLKDENIDLNRENQQLRVEIAHRSPKKLGRYTVAALEAETEKYKKEAQQLHKALEKSDNYIEELHEQLSSQKKDPSSKYSSVRVSTTTVTGPVKDAASIKRHLFNDDDPITSTSSAVTETETESTMSSFGGQKRRDRSGDSFLVPSLSSESETFANSPKKPKTESSGFELPSPATPSTPFSQLTLQSKATPGSDNDTRGGASSSVFSKPDNSDYIPDRDLCRKNLTFNDSVLDKMEVNCGTDGGNRKVTFKLDSDGESAFELPSEGEKTMNCTGNEMEKVVQSEVNRAAHDESITQEMVDCMQLLSNAERNVIQRKQENIAYYMHMNKLIYSSPRVHEGGVRVTDMPFSKYPSRPFSTGNVGDPSASDSDSTSRPNSVPGVNVMPYLPVPASSFVNMLPQSLPHPGPMLQDGRPLWLPHGYQDYMFVPPIWEAPGVHTPKSLSSMVATSSIRGPLVQLSPIPGVNFLPSRLSMPNSQTHTNAGLPSRHPYSSIYASSGYPVNTPTMQDQAYLSAFGARMGNLSYRQPGATSLVTQAYMPRN